MSVPKPLFVGATQGQTGSCSRGPGDGGSRDHWKDLDRKDGKKDQDSRSAPEPKKPEENPASEFSSASKHTALWTSMRRRATTALSRLWAQKK